jgi:hypothetical protein
MRKWFRHGVGWWGALTWGAAMLVGMAVPQGASTTTLSISQQPMGKSTCYIGAVEGDTRFNLRDLTDLGINSYRIFGGMPRWEPVDDSAIYGSPSIAAIKANPNVINWAAWDARMIQHQSVPGVSDATIFQDLLTAHIRPIVVLRNRDQTNKPDWMPNPPTTTADWNEWWEHVFATVYWLNVRHTFHVNDFEIHDDPDTAIQGWGGTEAQYATFARVTSDAIAYVYHTYLPGQVYHLYAPDASYENQWVTDALAAYPTIFDTIDYHQYSFGTQFADSIQYAHQLATAAGASNKPLWISEWGTYDSALQPSGPLNDQEPYGIATINNLIEMSRPGPDYVFGSDYYALYDTNKKPNEGLIAGNGAHRTIYYALRLGIRALQGCKTTYQTQTGNAQLTAITTRDSTGTVFLLVTNTGQTSQTVQANLAPLMTAGAVATLFRYDTTHADVSQPLAMAQPGQVAFTVPPMGAALVQVGVPPMPTPTVSTTPPAVVTASPSSLPLWLGAAGGVLAVCVALGLWFAWRRRTQREEIEVGITGKTPAVPTWLADEQDRAGR